MERKAKIFINSRPAETDYQAVFDGTVLYNNNTIQIEYKEANEGGNSIAISEDIITVNRLSTPSYTMVFEKDVPYMSSINSEYGSIPIKVMPIEIGKHITESEIIVNLTYDIYFGNHEHDSRYIYIRCVLLS